MANVNLPAPVLAAGAGLCLLAGYLLGAVAGPSSPDRTTGTVTSYDTGSGRLCLAGDHVEVPDGATELCGQWQRSAGSPTPRTGDTFRFVVVTTADAPAGTQTDADSRVLIYGDVIE